MKISRMLYHLINQKLCKFYLNPKYKILDMGIWDQLLQLSHYFHKLDDFVPEYILDIAP